MKDYSILEAILGSHLGKLPLDKMEVQPLR